MRAGAVVDSSVLIAAMHRRDAHHAEALLILRAADDGGIPPLLLTDFLLAEVINYLTRKGGSAVGREALRRIEASQGLRVERIPDTVYLRGKSEIFERIDGLSFVDALTVAFMENRGVTRIYSFDEDFDRVPRIHRLTRLP